MADAFLWRRAMSMGGDPVEVGAGDSVRLATGDVLLLPAIAADDFDPSALIRLVNPGTERTMSYGFAMYDDVAWGGSDAWREGAYRDFARVVGTTGSVIDPIATEGAVFRLARVMIAPDAVVGIDKGAMFGLYRVEDGAVEATIRGPLGEATRRWTPDSSGVATELDVADWKLPAAGGEPTALLELIALPLDKEADD